ncbi:MAG TPA: hypothetical protein VL572_01980 [Pyrinomonadaceae bacterium]|jgi:hypothetical protein|nr:hypothetical protein [Pyrinomonadaceae bacterium]
MSLSETDKNDVKQMVLNSLEHLFTDLTEKYNSQENHDMVLYLMDVENRVKQSLMDPVLT